MIFKTFWRNKQDQKDKVAVRVSQSDDFKYKTTIEIRFVDFDMMGYISHAVYFTYMEMARLKYWKQAVKLDLNSSKVLIREASLEYILPIFPEDHISIYVRTTRLGNTSFDLEYLFVKTQNNTEVICSRGKTTCVAFNQNTRKAIPIPETDRTKMINFEQLT